MPNMNASARTVLRQAKLAARDQLDPASRCEKSRRILVQLTEHRLLTAAQHLFMYVHFRSEVETLPLIEHFLAVGKTISVPLTLRKESRLLAVGITDPVSQLKPGCFGILEPTQEQKTQAVLDPATIDIALVPGSVFDRYGGRLGYGGGFYDRFLAQNAPQAYKIGLAYELQLVEEVPTEAHDQRMDMIITEEQLYDCRRIRNA
ncbi:MAG: 5-formyltetrahydrofolate cyclo-ligase [Candidatus Electronema aureum]|uniref:5-formyltetrahydrofolate cyclo-ligase n=1 Tax=Candidatus Electronema aureum TaxID=2005002 RepID=A0A521G1D0_9BACT|nr:MAG: 5-formyltetrahydrofolate cyclo-ligase [Candidatus Electronema aureum]